MTLPTPDPAFHWTAETWGYALRCRPLSAIAQHAFTSKQLRLRLPPGGVDDRYRLAWTQAAASVGASLEHVMRVRQVHGHHVRVLRRGTVALTEAAAKPDADALVSNAPDFVLSVQVADCVPILMADRTSGAVAAVHAGWRGTCAGVAAAAVRAMAEQLDANPAELVVAIGPSIGPCCYQVGDNVLQAFQAAGTSAVAIARWFSHDDGGVRRLDLWRANHDQLARAGVPPAHIHVSGLCTRTHREMFESYRVDGEEAGRMAALIRVPSGLER